MDVISEISAAIKRLIAVDNKPVVVFSGLWPFFKLIDAPPLEITQTFLKVLMDTVGSERGLLMPTFSGGYQDGLCDLDIDSSKNGLLSECFRKHTSVQRTLSAFFSFGIWTENKKLLETVTHLKPEFAWGDDSLYEWMEQENVHFIMLGVHPITCSYLHRMEWLVRDKIQYRYKKKFQGTLIRNREKIVMEETLFVRSLNPEVKHDFFTIYEKLIQGGLKAIKINGVSLAHMRALDMQRAVLPLVESDPFILIKNREDFAVEACM
jgi:aminoglycoside N3'-acetyltransferase